MPQNGGRLLLYTSSGVGFIIVILFYFALFKMFNKMFILPALLLFLIVYIYTSKRDFYNLKTKTIEDFGKASFFLKRNWHWIVLITILFSPFLFLPLYPPTEWDEISYHLPYAKHYVENNGLSVNPFLRYPLYAHNFDLLYALSLLFYDDILAHLIHAAAALLTALGIYNLGSLTSDKKTGAIAAFIFLSSPLVAHLMKTSYIDLGLTLFIFLGFYCISLWSITKQEYWLYLSGFATGIAIGSKYNGFLYFPMFAIWIAFQSRKFSSVMRFLVPVFIFGSPWYIRNFIISGDPISPFGGEIFGHWLWNKEDLIGQSENLLKGYGTPKDVISMLMLPWNLLFHYGKFAEGAISPGMVAAFLGVFLFKKSDGFNKKLCIFVFVNIIIWFFSTQVLRYLLPVFPMISLLSAIILIYLYENLIKRPINFFLGNNFSSRRLPQKIMGSVTVFLIILPILFLDKKIVKAISKNPLPVTSQMRNEYLSKEIESFHLLQIANKSPSLSIYQIGFENAFYFAKGKMIGDWFGPARYSTILEAVGNSEKLYEKLRAMDIQFFLVNTTGCLKLEFDKSLLDYFKLVAEDKHGKLYLLKELKEINVKEKNNHISFDRN
ncbi:MAG: hypothetical protein A2Y97_01445 [Nitrospirae bacterium RBG_13_39_12]|nr:MAG: hypothetical protein A2Y97_01445 [Nitrospirae bacterium RBG_13_39_12]